jgi:SAM-dependent methyltransferase
MRRFAAPAMPKREEKTRRAERRTGSGGEETAGRLFRDRHWLYQESVQSPEAHFRFFDRAYRRANGRLPRTLKEDFCGTGFLAASWVRHRPGNAALGIDLDEATLRWGRRHNLAPLPPDLRARVKLLRNDVLRVTRPKVDLVAALNFSYLIFHTPAELGRYFLAARRSLAPGGLLICDLFGGWEAQQPGTERIRFPGFTYFWELERYDPIASLARFHIHFQLRGGRAIRRAFTYEWRLWTIPELRDALAQAGFGSVETYWVRAGGRGGPESRTIQRVTSAAGAPRWMAFLTASARSPAGRSPVMS